MRILYLVSTLKRSGPTNQLYNIIKYLDRDKFEPCVVTLSPEPSESMWKDYKALGLYLHSLSLSRVGGVFLARRRLEKLLLELAPAVVHSQGIRADILVSKLSEKTASVASVRNFLQYDYPMTYGRLQGGLMVKKHVSALRKIDNPVAVSSAVANNLINIFSVGEGAFILNGVDTEVYSPTTREKKSSLRRKLGLPEKAKIAVCSGHLSERKDPLYLINNWKAILKNRKDYQLVFIGDGPLKIACLEAAKDTGNIHIVGRVKSVVDYLQASDFYISSSNAEGMPNAALEAMSCGLPVLLSDIPPHRELISLDAGIGGVYEKNSDNNEEFKESLMEFLHDDLSRSSQASLKLIDQELSAQVMSKKYQDIYEKFA